MLYIGFVIVSNGIFSRSLPVYRAEEEEKRTRFPAAVPHGQQHLKTRTTTDTYQLQRRAGAVVGRGP